MTPNRERAVRIANFSGYLGDRPEALSEVLAGDAVDVLIGDYLAEITLAALAGRYRSDRSLGYAESFLAQIRPHLATIAERGLRVVTNAGGFHPAALAAALRDAAAEAGVDLTVAHVEGDNVLDQLGALAADGHDLAHLDTGQPLRSWGVEPVAANAYLGGWGIAAALQAGAAVVVCGRVTDASLTLGPAAWWHGWSPDDLDAAAGAVTAGHVIECGPHATGGNFSGFQAVPGMVHPGFPIAEVAADGSSVITKHTRDGGTVTVDTVTAQLVYEIQGPLYLSPDVTVHLDTVRLTQLAPDRVGIGPVTGSPPPPTTKVAVFASLGWEIALYLWVTAPDVDAKVQLLTEQIRGMLAPGVDTLEVTRLGPVPVDPATQWEATVAVRVMATAREREPLSFARFARGIYGLYLSSYPGFFHDGGAHRATDPHPRIDYWPALLPAELADHRVVFASGESVGVAPVPSVPFDGQPAGSEPEPPRPMGPERRRALGDVVHARSGDKGGNSNVGVWLPAALADDDEAWEWLRRTLSTATLRELLPEAKDLPIVRHEFPHLRAVHVVLVGLLGTGGSSNLRVDQVGKAVGEYLRAKHLSIPDALVELLQEAHHV
jgi:hypothetical protein